MSIATTLTKLVNRIQSISLEQKRGLRAISRAIAEPLSKTESFVDANFEGNQLISGGAAWVSGLTFDVSPCTFVVDGVLYTSLASQVTLGAADATHPRIDVIAVNIDGTVEVVAGTAAASPAKPEVDPNTQVEVTFATIAATATEPSGQGNTDIYKEDAEWTSAVVGNVDAADTSDPLNGTKAIKFTAADNGDRVTLTAAAGISPAELDRIMFNIKPIDYGTSRRNRIRMALYNGTTRVSSWINLAHGDYGFDANSTSDYQFIHIPFGNFRPTGDQFDTLRIQVAAQSGNTLTCLFDDIKYQIGTPNTDTTDFAVVTRHNNWTKAQGTPISVLTDGATVSWDAGVSNVYSLTLGGNRTIAAPTNVKPGYTYILHLYQDGTGSRTVTWNSVFKWAGGTAPTLSTGASALDVLTFVADSSGNLHGSVGIADSQ